MERSDNISCAFNLNQQKKCKCQIITEKHKCRGAIDVDAIAPAATVADDTVAASNVAVDVDTGTNVVVDLMLLSVACKASIHCIL